jgi:hypothetical protein
MCMCACVCMCVCVCLRVCVCVLVCMYHERVAWGAVFVVNSSEVLESIVPRQLICVEHQILVFQLGACIVAPLQVDENNCERLAGTIHVAQHRSRDRKCTQFSRVAPVLRFTKNSCAEESTSFDPFCATVSFHQHNECWFAMPLKIP